KERAFSPRLCFIRLYNKIPRFALSGTLVAKSNSKNLLFHVNVTGKHHEKIVDCTGRGRLSAH
ncbi:hypothetical protein, partial [Enterobacter cloacae]|uniref:hypothetical protein n=1 Tax=Enterobacter cloacae TaxID=550 RepID=UPI0019552B58